MKAVPVAADSVASTSGTQLTPDIEAPMPPTITAPTSNAYDDSGWTDDQPQDEDPSQYGVPKRGGKVCDYNWHDGHR